MPLLQEVGLSLCGENCDFTETVTETTIDKVIILNPQLAIIILDNNMKQTLTFNV